MTVYVVDAWNDTKGEGVVQVYKDRPDAEAALKRLFATAGTWYGSVVKRAVW